MAAAAAAAAVTTGTIAVNALIEYLKKHPETVPNTINFFRELIGKHGDSFESKINELDPKIQKEVLQDLKSIKNSKEYKSLVGKISTVVNNAVLTGASHIGHALEKVGRLVKTPKSGKGGCHYNNINIFDKVVEFINESVESRKVPKLNKLKLQDKKIVNFYFLNDKKLMNSIIEQYNRALYYNKIPNYNRYILKMRDYRDVNNFINCLHSQL